MWSPRALGSSWRSGLIRCRRASSAGQLRQRTGTGADVGGGGTNQPALALLLEDVSRPAGGAGTGEHRGEQLRWDVGEIEHHRRPELDVSGQHTIGLAGLELSQRRLL